MSKQAAKNILVKLIVGAGQASPQPPVGPALGSKGVKAIDFCKDFNARTAHLNPGTPVPAIITVKPDRSFTYEIKSPPTSWLLLKAAGLDKGTAEAGKKTVGKVSLKHIYEIAKIKKTVSISQLGGDTVVTGSRVCLVLVLVSFLYEFTRKLGDDWVDSGHQNERAS